MNTWRFVIALTVLIVSSCWATPIQTANTTDCFHVSQTQISNLPFGRSITALADLTPGVDPTNANHVLASITDYSTDPDGQTQLAQTMDGGTTWTDITVPLVGAGGQTYTNSRGFNFGFDSKGNAFYIYDLNNATTNASELDYGTFDFSVTPPKLTNVFTLATLPAGDANRFANTKTVKSGSSFDVVWNLNQTISYRTSTNGTSWTPTATVPGTFNVNSLNLMPTVGNEAALIIDGASSTANTISYSPFDGTNFGSPTFVYSYMPVPTVGPFQSIGAVAGYNISKSRLEIAFARKTTKSTQILEVIYNPATSMLTPIWISGSTPVGQIVINPSLTIAEKTGQEFIFWNRVSTSAGFRYQQVGTQTLNDMSFSVPVALTSALTPSSNFVSHSFALMQPGNKMYAFTDGASGPSFIRAFEVNFNMKGSLSTPATVTSGSTFDVDIGGTSSFSLPTTLNLTLPTGAGFLGITAGSSNFMWMTPAVGSSGLVIGKSIMPLSGFTATIQVQATAPSGSTLPFSLHVFDPFGCNLTPTDAKKGSVTIVN